MSPCPFRCPAPLTICCLKASRSRRAVAYACRSANRSGSVSWCRSANVANSRSPNSNRSPKRWIANRYFPLPSGACCSGPRITIIIPSATCCSTRCRLCCARANRPAPRQCGTGLRRNRDKRWISTALNARRSSSRRWRRCARAKSGAIRSQNLNSMTRRYRRCVAKGWRS